jgi:MraZ protein
MDRFVSHFVNKLDAKGRVSLPAPFRAMLLKDGYDGLYVHPALGQPTLDCGGGRLIAELEQLVKRFPAYSRERELLSTAVFGMSQQVKLDGEGRFVVSDLMRSHAGVTDSIVFLGLDHKFQIWSPERFAQHRAAAAAQMQDVLNLLSAIPQAASSSQAAVSP